MGTYDISKINNWFNDFTSARNKFNNKYYSDFTNSYVRNCNDSAVINMYNKLNQHYEKIKRINLRVNNIWDDFLFDVQAIDNRLAGQHVNAKDSLISSKLSKIQNLEEYESDLNTKISSLSAKVGIVDKIGLAENKSASENFAEVFERCGATVATFTTSLLEGVVKLAEDLVDAIALTGAAVCSVSTIEEDLINYIVAEVKGDDSLKTNKTEQLWEDTRSFVSQDFTGFAFDSFYKNTQVGQWMKENAYGFDSVRAVGSEVGEVIAVTALSAVTGGSAAVIYGAAKVAEHTEENWQDQNVSTTGGLLKGMLQGSLDGAFFALGAKGDNVMKAVASSAVKQGEKIALKKTAILFGKTMFECGCSIVQDESSILVNTIFSNNTIYDVNGEVLEFKNFKDKWNYYYKQAGGNEGLVISMATAGILSFASDAMDVNKIMKNTSVDTAGTGKSMSNSKNMDVSSTSKKINPDVNTNNMKNIIDDVNPKNVEVSSNVKNINANDNLDVLRKEYDDLIKWKNSEEGLYSKRFNEVYGDRYGNNSRYKRNMDRITKLEEVLIDTPRINKVQESLNQLDIPLDEKNKITKNLCARYKSARINANGKYETTFMSYRDHGELHILEVADYSKNMAQKNVHLNNSDIMEVYFAGLTHDLGMEDSMVILNKKTKLIEFASNVDGGTVRKNHPLNSALIVLQDSEDLLLKGMDSDKVALLTLTHSKSTSGITDFSDKNMWIKAIDNLDDASKKIGIEFDADRMKSIINDDNSFKKIKEQAVCLRDGDAMSKVPLDNNGNQLMQTGQSVTLVNSKPRKNFSDVIESTLEKEMDSIDDILSSGKKIDDTLGKAYHIGENNVRFTSDYTGEGKYVANVYLVDANNVPNASAMVIKERVGEINTYGNIRSREMNIHLPKEAKYTNLGDFYEGFNYDNNASVRIHIVFDL